MYSLISTLLLWYLKVKSISLAILVMNTKYIVFLKIRILPQFINLKSVYVCVCVYGGGEVPMDYFWKSFPLKNM
jgi:hypothetical protein